MVSDALRPKSDDLAIGGSLFSMAWPLLWPALLFFAAFHLFAVDIPPAWLQALGQVEIGNRDAAIGAAGEVSRYQILPATWQAMAAPGDRPTDARAAGRVARRFWGEHCDRLAVRRAVTPRDAYALWHRPGLYRRVGYRFDALPAVVQRRCMRFARLTEVGR